MLDVRKLYFGYDTHSVLENISFAIPKGACVAIIGESGCGKSTLLKLIYGVLQPASGELFWEGKKLLGSDHYLVPGETFMKYLAQDFDLMPYTTVAENIGKFLSNFFPEEKQERIAILLDIFEMTSFANTKVRYLSGGQKQRVALARALAKEPELLLLDEPFSHIDNFRKNRLRRNLFRYLRKEQITCIVATHDSADILSYTDTTIVIKDGKIIANTGTPELYRSPKSTYVASLFNEINILPLSIFSADANPEHNVILYPHDLHLASQSLCETRVVTSNFNGNHYLIEAKIGEKTLFFEHETELIPNQTVFLNADTALLHSRII